MHDALGVQVLGGRGNAVGDSKDGTEIEALVRRIEITGAGLEAGRPGEVAETGVDQRHHQTMRFRRVLIDLAKQRNQVRMGAGSNAGSHFLERQTIAGQLAFEDFYRYRLRIFVLQPVRLMNHPGGAFAQLMRQLQAVPDNRCNRRPRQRRQFNTFTKRIAGISQPAKARQGEQPFGQRSEAIGGDAEQFQAGASCHLWRQI